MQSNPSLYSTKLNINQWPTEPRNTVQYLVYSDTSDISVLRPNTLCRNIKYQTISNIFYPSLLFAVIQTCAFVSLILSIYMMSNYCCFVPALFKENSITSFLKKANFYNKHMAIHHLVVNLVQQFISIMFLIYSHHTQQHLIWYLLELKNINPAYLSTSPWPLAEELNIKLTKNLALLQLAFCR